MWFDSSSLDTYTYYNDGSSAQWVVLNRTGATGVDGSDGIQGIQGIQGTQGTQGIQGTTGTTGATGLGFTIAKTYTSVANLTADTAPTSIVAGQFALIDTGSVEDVDTGKLYLWNGSAYSYVSDISGASGIQGETGATGPSGANGTNGADGAAGADGTDGADGADLVLPSQTGNSGRYLTTDGTNTSWDTISSGASITASDSPPSSPSSGDVWFDTDDLVTYVYYNDGDSLQWVSIG
jgi:hypothetical protein